jgi:hypothetical protein
MPNNRMHADKIELRRFAMQLHFAGDAERYRELERLRVAWKGGRADNSRGIVETE